MIDDLRSYNVPGYRLRRSGFSAGMARLPGSVKDHPSYGWRNEYQLAQADGEYPSPDSWRALPPRLSPDLSITDGDLR